MSRRYIYTQNKLIINDNSWLYHSALKNKRFFLNKKKPAVPVIDHGLSFLMSINEILNL